MTRQNQTKPRESDLYAPVKQLLERLGFDVKGEIGKADIVALRPADGNAVTQDETGNIKDLVIVELKTGFSLTLFHQAIERQSMTDHVYVAVPRGRGRAFQKSLKNNISLCSRLGLGLITVRLKDNLTEIHLDPAPYQPRKSKQKRALLLREFQRLKGDPNRGGHATGLSATGPKAQNGADVGANIGAVRITAYRQDALTCLKFLSLHGPQKASHLAKQTKIDNARPIMSDNHYGWFMRMPELGRGFYHITPAGQAALTQFKATLDLLG